jgi:hypothetical protein
MAGKYGGREGVEGAAVQGPCDTAKATLLQAQSPAMEGTSCDTTPEVAATGIGRFPFSRLNPSGRWAASNEPA